MCVKDKDLYEKKVYITRADTRIQELINQQLQSQTEHKTRLECEQSNVKRLLSQIREQDHTLRDYISESQASQTTIANKEQTIKTLETTLSRKDSELQTANSKIKTLEDSMRANREHYI